MTPTRPPAVGCRATGPERCDLDLVRAEGTRARPRAAVSYASRLCACMRVSTRRIGPGWWVDRVCATSLPPCRRATPNTCMELGESWWSVVSDEFRFARPCADSQASSRVAAPEQFRSWECRAKGGAGARQNLSSIFASTRIRWEPGRVASTRSVRTGWLCCLLSR